MPLNNNLHVPLNNSPVPQNINNLNINGPLLVSSVLGNEDLQEIESFINYDYQEISQLPISPLLGQGYLPLLNENIKKKKIFYIDFNCKGKKIKKVTV